MICSRHPQRSSQLLVAALVTCSDIVVVIDIDGVIRYASPVAEPVLGIAPRALRTRDFVDLVHVEDRDALLDLLADTAAGLPPASAAPIRVRVERGDGRWAELRAAVLGPEMLGDRSLDVSVALSDVAALARTERDLATARAQYDFTIAHDAITGLPNRFQLESHLDALSSLDPEAARRSRLLMAKLLGIDELRERFGRVESDSIVRALGRKIRSIVSPGELVGVLRTGEFVVVNGPEASEADVDRLAEALLALVDTPLREHPVPLDLTMVIGQTALIPERDAACSLDRLQQAADRARMSGPHARSEAGAAVDDRAERIRPAARIEAALPAGELELLYQPMRDVRSGRICAFEGLLRWNHPDAGVLPAAEFLPAVEGTATMVAIGEFVLISGCAQLASWQRRYGAASPSLALNVSARQLRDGDLAERLDQELTRSGADPTGLCLEITETQALEREPAAAHHLQRVRELGVSIALDDFGTGYSSLRHLHEVAADVLKIDRSFVADVGIDAGATAIVRAAIDLGAAFGMTTIAEGVTTIEQHRILVSMGCDRIQGFLIAPAVAPELAEAMLTTEPLRETTVGVDDATRDADVIRARGTLASIDERYEPSDDEVAALAGIAAVDATSWLHRTRSHRTPA